MGNRLFGLVAVGLVLDYVTVYAFDLRSSLWPTVLVRIHSPVEICMTACSPLLQFFHIIGSCLFGLVLVLVENEVKFDSSRGHMRLVIQICF